VAPGMKADLVVIGGDRTHPYDALVAATPKSVRLVVVDGAALYGDSSLRSAGQATPDCDSLDICGASKFACVAVSGGTAANKLAQTYPQIRDVITTELKKYDDKNLTEWDF